MYTTQTTQMKVFHIELEKFNFFTHIMMKMGVAWDFHLCGYFLYINGDFCREKLEQTCNKLIIYAKYILL